MGVSKSIRLTPFIKIEDKKFLEIPKVRRICQNHPKKNNSDNKFCSECGSKIVTENYTLKEELRPYKVLDDCDELYSPEYLDGILIPNIHPPHPFNTNEDDSGVIDLIEKTTIIEKQIEWCKKKYNKEIEKLREAYGEKNVRVCWGLVHYRA